jgi:hypothetical protein
MMSRIEYQVIGDRIYAMEACSNPLNLSTGQGAHVYRGDLFGSGISWSGVVNKLMGRADWIRDKTGKDFLVSKNSMERLTARVNDCLHKKGYLCPKAMQQSYDAQKSYFDADLRTEFRHVYGDRVFTVNDDVRQLEAYLRQKIHECPATHRLYQDACRAQEVAEIGIKFCSPEDGVAPFGASANYTEGFVTLCLGKQNEYELLYSLVFELTNLAHKHRFIKVDNLARKLSENEYARQIEHIEYEGFRICMKTLREAVVTNKWNEKVFNNRERAEQIEFDEYWMRIKNSEHAQRVRNTHRRMVAWEDDIRAWRERELSLG